MTSAILCKSNLKRALCYLNDILVWRHVGATPDLSIRKKKNLLSSSGSVYKMQVWIPLSGVHGDRNRLTKHLEDLSHTDGY